MTYARFDQSHTDDPRWIEAGADAFALHVAAVVWCDRQLTDGIITEVMASRVSLAVPPDRTTAAVASLVEQGFWSRADDGDLRIVPFHEHAFPAEQVKRTRARWAGDKQRKRQHDLGDHALCKDPKFCPAIREGSTVESTLESGGASTGGGSHLYQTQPDPTQPDRREGVGEGDGEVGSASGDRAHASGAHGSGATPPDGSASWTVPVQPPGIPTVNGK